MFKFLMKTTLKMECDFQPANQFTREKTNLDKNDLSTACLFITGKEKTSTPAVASGFIPPLAPEMPRWMHFFHLSPTPTITTINL
jgi:hypothetical protein